MKPPKYNNTPKAYGGATYQSTAEARYAMQLDFRLQAGEVLRWRGQVPLRFVVNGVPVLDMRVDFLVCLTLGPLPYEFVDVKGYMNRANPATRLYRNGCALLYACTGDHVVTYQRGQRLPPVEYAARAMGSAPAYAMTKPKPGAKWVPWTGPDSAFPV